MPRSAAMVPWAPRCTFMFPGCTFGASLSPEGDISPCRPGRARDDLPALIKQAQQALHLDPAALPAARDGASPDHADSIERTLGALTPAAIGVAVLRDRYGTSHGRLAVPTGLGPRHARVAIGTASTWRELMLDTLANPDAPWRKTSATAPPATSTLTTSTGRKPCNQRDGALDDAAVHPSMRGRGCLPGAALQPTACTTLAQRAWVSGRNVSLLSEGLCEGAAARGSSPHPQSGIRTHSRAAPFGDH